MNHSVIDITFGLAKSDPIKRRTLYIVIKETTKNKLNFSRKKSKLHTFGLLNKRNKYLLKVGTSCVKKLKQFCVTARLNNFGLKNQNVNKTDMVTKKEVFNK